MTVDKSYSFRKNYFIYIYIYIIANKSAVKCSASTISTVNTTSLHKLLKRSDQNIPFTKTELLFWHKIET